MDRINPTQEALFREFTWHHDKSRGLSGKGQFLETVLDISAGAAVALKILEASDLRRAGEEAPLLASYDAGRLLRLAIRSMEMLSLEAEEHIERANEGGGL